MHAVHCKLEDNNGFLTDSCPNVRYIPKFHANDIQLDIWQDVRKMFIFNQHHRLCVVDTGAGITEPRMETMDFWTINEGFI